MERKYRGKQLKKDDAWVSSWKQEERKWMKDDMVTYSKCPEATDENDLDLAIAVFREGMHIEKEEEDRSDRVGTYRGRRAGEIGRQQ